MSIIRFIKNNSKLIFIRHPWRRKILIFLLILSGGFVLFIAISGSQLLEKVWLPENYQYRPDNEVLFDLPVKSEDVITKYGRAIRYTTTSEWSIDYKDSKPWATIYEFRVKGRLKAADCPNISNIETLLSSGCDKLGAFHGQPVYTIHRRLPSGVTEYYVKLKDAFIYISAGGDGGQNLDYLNSFVSMPRSRVSSYLTANIKRVGQVRAKQKAVKDATDKINALAYTRLDFTPAIPTRLPSGWQLNTRVTTNPIQIDGPDPGHPNMVNLDYTNRNEQFVSVHSGKLANFMIGTQCGPSPGYSMEILGCHKVTGTDYYEAIVYDERNDFVRYLYRPVGDSLVISHIVVYANDDKSPGYRTELTKIQDAITLSAQPSELASLKGSIYHKLYY